MRLFNLVNFLFAESTCNTSALPLTLDPQAPTPTSREHFSSPSRIERVTFQSRSRKYSETRKSCQHPSIISCLRSLKKFRHQPHVYSAFGVHFPTRFFRQLLVAGANQTLSLDRVPSL